MNYRRSESQVLPRLKSNLAKLIADVLKDDRRNMLDHLYPADLPTTYYYTNADWDVYAQAADLPKAPEWYVRILRIS